MNPALIKQKVKRLSVAKAGEIAKAVASESNIIIMDEPTASISERIRRLFKIIRNSKGIMLLLSIYPTDWMRYLKLAIMLP